MSKYIDAEKLIAEIERRLKDYWGICFHDVKAYNEDSNVRELKELLTLIESLQREQPEVDLEEYIENEIKHYGLSLYEASYGTFSASEIDRIMRKFYELGRNARKEE